MPSHYKFHYIEEEIGYYFDTDLDVSYKVTFTESNTLSDLAEEGIANVYSVNIDRLGSDKKSVKDLRIGETVSYILTQFLSDRSNSILFVCSADNMQAYCRYRKFNGWYSNSSLKDQYIKSDLIAKGQTPEETYFTSVIYHPENPSAEAIEKAINTTKDYFDKDAA